ncbi:hypothetical protein Tco_0616469 [Tanacetum coccineum]
MDDPNITMEEYIRLEEEKARRRSETFNWQTATYGKREYYDDEDNSFTNIKTEFPAIVFDDITTIQHSLMSPRYFDDLDFFKDFENEFPAIVYNDALTSKLDLLTEPTISPHHIDEFDLKDETSLSECTYNDNDKVDIEQPFGDMSVIPLPNVINVNTQGSNKLSETNFFKDFENEFPAIVYNDALTSKSDFLAEPTVNPQHIDEFDLKDETSLSECDEEEQNVLYFNDLFSFNVIYPDDSKSNADNHDDKIDIKHSSGDLSVKPLPNVINVDDGAYAHVSNKIWKQVMIHLINFSKLKLLSRN